jgi:hypothetical protein
VAGDRFVCSWCGAEVGDDRWRCDYCRGLRPRTIALLAVGVLALAALVFFLVT